MSQKAPINVLIVNFLLKIQIDSFFSMLDLSDLKQCLLIYLS